MKRSCYLLLATLTWLCWTDVVVVVASSKTSSSSSSSSTGSNFPPTYWSQRLSQSQLLAQLEQDVEDYNAHLVATATTAAETFVQRRLICLPLDERFDPPMGVFSHGHVQTGDKLSVPRNFWQAIQASQAEVPWLMQVSRVEGITKHRVVLETNIDSSDEPRTSVRPSPSTSEFTSMMPLDKVVGGPLDFRAPSNYCFLPWWMMRALGLQPRDVVDVRLITTVPPGSAAQLRPHSSQFAKDIANPQAVLETELKHYSTLTRGATIAFDYNQQRYWFDVVDLRSAPRGEKVPMAKVQDCDIATEFLPAKDTLKQRK